jgi:hypothetical protein
MIELLNEKLKGRTEVLLEFRLSAVVILGLDPGDLSGKYSGLFLQN